MARKGADSRLAGRRAEGRGRDPLSQLARFLVVGAVNTTRARVLYVSIQAVGALSTSVLVLLFVQVGRGKVGVYLVAIPPVTLCMFAANRIWTFTER